MDKVKIIQMSNRGGGKSWILHSLKREDDGLCIIKSPLVFYSYSTQLKAKAFALPRGEHGHDKLRAE